MTLVWLAATLAVIVWGGVFLIWDLRIQARRQYRALLLSGERILRQREDAIWASSRQAEYQHAMTLSLARAEMETADALIEALSVPPLYVVEALA